MPGDNHPYRLLMRCYARLGLRGRAIEQYRICEKILYQEYGTSPSSETRSICERLAARQRWGRTAQEPR